MRKGLLFGTAGVPHSAPGSSSHEGVKEVARLGLEAMEVEFVRGVRMDREKALSLGQLAEEKGIVLSAHAPYYINLNATDPSILSASRERLLATVRVTALFQGSSVVFHPGYYMGRPAKEAFTLIKAQLQSVLKVMREEGSHEVCLRPEIMGKGSQFGSLEEVVALCQQVEGLLPCVDFAHFHARALGGYNRYEEFSSLLKTLERKLGRERGLEDMHIHLSGIEYGPKGERRHLNLKDSDLNYRDLLKALKDYGVKGCLICESPNRQGDAMRMKRVYESL